MRLGLTLTRYPTPDPERTPTQVPRAAAAADALRADRARARPAARLPHGHGVRCAATPHAVRHRDGIRPALLCQPRAQQRVPPPPTRALPRRANPRSTAAVCPAGRFDEGAPTCSKFECRLPAPQLAARAAWAAPRIPDALLNCSDPSGSSWCGRQRVPTSPIALPLTNQARSSRGRSRRACAPSCAA